MRHIELKLPWVTRGAGEEYAFTRVGMQYRTYQAHDGSYVWECPDGRLHPCISVLDGMIASENHYNGEANS